jgi:hypothetical protein
MIELIINDKQVKLKDFPSRALKNTIMGFLTSLNLEEPPKEVKIIIKDKPSEDGT